MRRVNFYRNTIISALVIVFLGFTAAPSFGIYKEEVEKESKEVGIKTDDSSVMPYRPTPAKIQAEEKIKYAPGEFIVKLKDESGKTLDAKLSIKALSLSATTGIASVDELNSKYSVIQMEPVFKSLKSKQITLAKSNVELYEDIKAKYPERSIRATKDAKLPNLLNIYKIEIEDKDADILSICAEYQQDPNVEYCQPNYIMEAYMVPNDPYYSSSGSWGQDYDDLWGLKRIHMEEAWDIETGSSDIVVAVVDTGAGGHLDLYDNIWQNLGEDADGDGNTMFFNSISNTWTYDSGDLNGIDDDGNGFVDDIMGWDFSDDNFAPEDGHGHGTHLSGTIAAVTNNGIGIAGISWHSKIMALRGLDDFGSGYLTDLSKAIIYAADNGADVINCSWGPRDPMEAPLFLVETIDYAYSHGCVIVAAAGNSNDDVGDESYGYPPASIQNVIAVASTNHLDQRSSYSNYGLNIDVAAPGGDGDQDSWSRHSDPNAYGGSYRSSSKEGAFALFWPFPPDTEVIWYTMEGPDRGITDVYIDDSFHISIDNYSPSFQFVQKVIDIPPNSIEFRLTVSGNKNPSSAGYRMDIDARSTISEGVFDDGYFIYDDGGDSLARRNILSLRAPDTDMYCDPWYPESCGPMIVDEYYYRARGTSMAAPHVSGLVALILSQNPTWGNSVVRTHLINTADNIDDLNPDYAGLLGSGRINAYNALSTPLQQQDIISVYNHAFDDSAGDGDGVIDPGENINIIVNLLSWFDAAGVSATISTSDPYITLIDAEANFSDIPAGSYVSNASNPFSLRIHDSYKYGHIFTFEINISAENYTGSDSFEVIGQIPYQEGWPVKTERGITSFGITTSPALGDLDGDGDIEVIIGSDDQRVYALHHDGTLVAGWPVIAGSLVRISSPALCDIDGDGDMEVVVGSMDHKVYAWHHADFDGDGYADLVEGWPVETGHEVVSSPALGDIDADGDLEVVVGSRDGKVYAFHHGDLDGDGVVDPVEGWPVEEGYWVDSSPALGDLDGDGDLEIITWSVGTYYLRARHHNGTMVDGWPVFFINSTGQLNSPVLGDLDGDGDMEVVAAREGLAFAFHHDGAVVDGWPARINRDNVWSSPALGDLDGDGDIEVIIASTIDKIYAFHHGDLDGDGVVDSVEGWPLSLGLGIGTTWSSPALGDLDGDGDTEIVIGSADYQVFAWDSSGDPANIEWGMFRHDSQRTGLYTKPFLCGDVNGDGSEMVDISDLLYLIDYMFNGGPAPEPLWVANVDGSSEDPIVIDISDLLYLVDYMFLNGPPPNCSGQGAQEGAEPDTGGWSLEQVQDYIDRAKGDSETQETIETEPARELNSLSR